MTTLTVVKIGGNIVDDATALTQFLTDFAAIQSAKILVHGGGKLATQLADTLGVQQQMIDGRRITDAETLKIVTMVYAGLINKTIVAKLQSVGANAIGLTGADANTISADQRQPTNEQPIHYGFVGDINKVNSQLIHIFLQQQLIPVFAPITHNGQGQLLNTNADTIAQSIATAMSALYDTVLIYSFEKNGVLLDVYDDDSVIPVIQPDYYQILKANQQIFAGMIPKLDNAFRAIEHGVKKVIIGNAINIHQLISGQSGTTIQHG